MSDQNRSEWNDDLDFESLADEHEVDVDFADEDLSDFEDSVYGTDEPPQANTEEPAPEAAPAPAPKAAKVKRKGGVSGGWLGFMFGTAILVSSVGLASAVLILTGLDPLTLWNPSGLTAFDQVINFQDHPQNLLYLVGAGILLLMVLGSAAVARSARSTNARLAATADLLERVTALRLEDEKGWSSPDFKADPECAGFVAETLGSWRMQLSRQKRLVGLEGELLRLAKAVSNGGGSDLNGRFDNPSVGTVSDEFTRLLDELASARKTASDTVNKDSETSGSAMGLLQDARTWNHATLDRLGVQGAALEQIAQEVGLLAAKAGQLGEGEVDHKALAEELKAVQNQPGGSSLQGAVGVAGELEALVEKGSKLAFQIAMEVARLGQRGERLLPMTKDMEELTTRFREVASGLKNASEPGTTETPAVATGLTDIISRLEQASAADSSELGKLAADLGPRTGSVAEGLGELAQGFNNQDDRLTGLGENLAEITGLEFDSTAPEQGPASIPSADSMSLASSDPFSSGQEEEAGKPAVDPFRTDNIDLPGEDATASDPDFLASESSARESLFGDAPQADADGPEVELDTPLGSQADSPLDGPLDVPMDTPLDSPLDSPLEPQPESAFETPDPVSSTSDVFGNIPLSGTEEKVYDLDEFDAVRDENQAETDTDRIYDLSEFGAERVG